MTQPTIPVSHRKLDAGRIPGIAAIPDVCEIKLMFQFNTVPQFSKIHGSGASALTMSVALADQIFDALAAPWTTNIAGLVSTNYRFLGVSIRDMSLATNPEFFSTHASHDGVGAVAELPRDVASVLTENIAARGRGLKGRIYLSGWTVAADDANGQMATATRTALNALGTAWMGALPPLGLTPCVAKPARQEYIGVTGAHHEKRDAGHSPVTGYIVTDLKWDTQRRRDK